MSPKSTFNNCGSSSIYSDARLGRCNHTAIGKRDLKEGHSGGVQLPTQHNPCSGPSLSGSQEARPGRESSRLHCCIRLIPGASEERYTTARLGGGKTNCQVANPAFSSRSSGDRESNREICRQVLSDQSGLENRDDTFMRVARSQRRRRGFTCWQLDRPRRAY